LAGEGLFEGKRVEGDRRQKLEQQIKGWETLHEKLQD